MAVVAVVAARVLAEAAVKLFSAASLDLSDDRHWRQVVGFVMAGTLFLAYAAAHVAFRRWPEGGRAVAARAVVTVVGCAAGVSGMTGQGTTPAGCGMAWLAGAAVPLLVFGFVAVEVAAWLGWSARVSRCHPTGSPNPAGPPAAARASRAAAIAGPRGVATCGVSRVTWTGTGSDGNAGGPPAPQSSVPARRVAG
jgi:hypothetical protein